MKKLTSISNQIQNNTFSYTGRGAFESIVKKHRDIIISWLEDLVPLQKQMETLNELENVEFQKRNYTRILSKLLTDEYQEFVSLNILVRDSNTIARYYNDEYNLTVLYDKLIADKFLKYPGKNEKYVDFSIFQQFLITYRDDLLQSLEGNTTNQQIVTQERTIQKEIEPQVKEIASVEPIEDILEEPVKTKKETNWTNLLLGKLR